MTPIQYQKQLRLVEARRLLLATEIDATSAAYQVGYESATQFNREYARFFWSAANSRCTSIPGIDLVGES
ncbi:helix-turn-helix domain-containing protein [Paenibacillus pabuli]|uniref:helix-turn-helix domain-containing protein n=1 Tax=Paenibacillus pabuli TaxID=1472 RepID=UPI0032B4FBB9